MSYNDAKGQEFLTDFDPDGVVNSVRRVDAGHDDLVVGYEYGGAGVENGQPTKVTDGLSGVVQEIGYAPAGSGGVGLPAFVRETNGGDVYRMDYAYNAVGDRAATTQTDNGTVVARWGYYDHRPIGDLTRPSRAFTTLCRLDAAGARTAEEFHYYYDQDGRLVATAFAQTPSAAAPVPGGGWYDAQSLPSSRARAQYEYDAGGRLTNVATYWEAQGGAPVLVAQNQCGYETAGLNRGLKTSSAFKMQTGATPGALTARTETYGYDALNDWLTEAHYADGNLDPNPTRAYDTAGNRSDMVVDNLNRATTLYPGFTATNDILGNRTSKTIGGNTFEFGWDCLNRMVTHGRPAGANPWQAQYAYRADGMRVSKSVYGKATRFRYDGQMGIEDVEASSAGTTVTRYGLGARGIDLIERTDSNGVTTGFPIYDAHGNMVATLGRSGTNGYSIGDCRIYSAWGDIRGPQVTGDPKGRHCASLGHKADDESGMVYMRARYYEPTTGRFISEDLKRYGNNWFSYCLNSPTNIHDKTGCDPYDQFVQVTGILKFAAVCLASWQTMDMESEYGLLMKALDADWFGNLTGLSNNDAYDYWRTIGSPKAILITIGYRLGGELGAKLGAMVALLDWASGIASRLGTGAMTIAAYDIRMQWYVDQAFEE